MNTPYQVTYMGREGKRVGLLVFDTRREAEEWAKGLNLADAHVTDELGPQAVGTFRAEAAQSYYELLAKIAAYLESEAHGLPDDSTPAQLLREVRAAQGNP